MESIKQALLFQNVLDVPELSSHEGQGFSEDASDSVSRLNLAELAVENAVVFDAELLFNAEFVKLIPSATDYAEKSEAFLGEIDQ